jgi:hypothetical protein
MADTLGSSAHICDRCPGPPLGTPLHGHVQQGLMLRIPSITPRIQKLRIWPSSDYGTGLHMRSTSLTLSSSLRVKGLTWRCYIWNDKSYKLALTLLNFQGSTKPTNTTPHVSLGLHGPTSQLLQATNGLGCYTHRQLCTITKGVGIARIKRIWMLRCAMRVGTMKILVGSYN